MSMDKNKAIETAVAQIERAFGKGSIMCLGSGQVIEVETISTGSLGLDIALGVGGLPRGRVIEVDAQLAGISRIESMLGINKAAHATRFLGLSHGLQCQRCLA